MVTFVVISSFFWQQFCQEKREKNTEYLKKEFSQLEKYIHNIKDVPDPDTGIRYPVNFCYPVDYPVSGKILPDIYRIIFQFLRLVKLV